MGTNDVTVVLIRERCDYEKLFGEFVEMRGTGNERMAFCCFHENKDTPSLSINLTEGLFHCKNPACDAKGDIITFYQRVRSLKFPEAVAELARRCGIPEPNEETPRPAKKYDAAQINSQNEDLLAAYVAGDRKLPPKPTKVTLVPEEEHYVDEQIVDAMHERLLSMPEKMEWLEVKRGLKRETIIKFKLGHDGQRFYIPIRDEDGRCRNIRRYKPEAQGADKMISWREGYGKARLFPINLYDPTQPVVFFEGEMDCLLALQMGFNALTTTGGAGTWRDTWNPLFKYKTVVICYDADDAGRKGATSVANKLAPDALSVQIVTIPLSEPKGADFTDYIVGHGHTVEDFNALIASAPKFQVTGVTPPTPPDVVPELVHLSQATRAEYHNQPVKFNVMVSGKTTSPYIIPRIVRAFCPAAVRGSMPMCERCPINKQGGPIVDELEFKSNDVLLFTNTTDSALKSAVKTKIGIPTKCGYARHEVLQAMNVEEVQLIPEIERTEAEAPYVTTSAYYLGHGLQANRSYVMTGVTVPEPKRQLATHIIDTAIESQSNIEAFRLTPDVVSRLKVFQPTEPGVAGLWQRLGAIYEDLERVTRIYKRRDIMLAVDLTFHSALQFMFQGERLQRGWVEALIIGDSRTGKTVTVQRMLEYYGAGEFTTGENTSLAGLVGGLHQIGTSWTLQWGRVPLNDSRLLAIDEAGNLPHEQIARMSSMRSSGVADITKIHREQTRARTRLVWISNPRASRSLSSYSQGVLAVKELIGAPEDVARFDIVVSAASGDVPLAVVNAQREQERPEIFIDELCHQRVMFAWSRKSNQIVWAEGATEEVLKLATEQGQQFRYATEIPLVEPNEQRIKLARLSVATAILFFSVTDDGETVIVTMDHVRFAAQFLGLLYTKPSLSFAEYAQNQRTKYVLADEEDVARIIRKVHNTAAAFMEQEQFNARDLQEILAVNDRDELRTIVTSLRDDGFLQRRGGSQYFKTPAAIKWLRRELSNGKEDEIDFENMMNGASPEPDF